MSGQHVDLLSAVDAPGFILAQAVGAVAATLSVTFLRGQAPLLPAREIEG